MNYKEITEANELKQILSSCHLNFLLGAGINGDLLPKLNEFHLTINLLKKILNEPIINFEESVNKLTKEQTKEVLKLFVNEFNDFYLNKLDFTKNSYSNIVKMIQSIYTLVDKSENTIDSMSKINFFTFNYDDILEKAIKEEGMFVNVVSPSNLSTLKYHNVIAKSIDNAQIIPSFVITKLHGQINDGKLRAEDIVLPGNEKFNLILNKDFFQLLFRMKTELLKENSVLFVLGYSWGDGHANNIIKDALNNGLTVIWFKYKNDEELPKEILEENTIVIEPYNQIQDTSKTCYELLEEVTSR
ncbi:MAG: SIR2 family protein [Bacilli bacterium]|jgi:hypothetical protein|nr:SIR2 family protein [Bacilli bacterium]